MTDQRSEGATVVEGFTYEPWPEPISGQCHLVFVGEHQFEGATNVVILTREDYERLRDERDEFARQAGECSAGYQTLERELTTVNAERDVHANRLASLIFSGLLDQVTGHEARQYESEYVDAKARVKELENAHIADALTHAETIAERDRAREELGKSEQDAARFAVCMAYGFPVRNQTAHKPEVMWTINGEWYGGTTLQCIDTAIQAESKEPKA